MIQLPGEEEFLLPPLVVRRNDTSATSIDEWTGACCAACRQGQDLQACMWSYPACAAVPARVLWHGRTTVFWLRCMQVSRAMRELSRPFTWPALARRTEAGFTPRPAYVQMRPPHQQRQKPLRFTTPLPTPPSLLPHTHPAGQRKREEVADDVRPISVNPLGNYAVQISWSDGFNQVGTGGGRGGCARVLMLRELRA